MLRLLYLSDIHFKEPGCLNSRIDLASNDRKHLLDDLEDIVKKSKKSIDAIVVTGDITFKAHSDEFGAATKWLKEIADRNAIDESKIFVVPGNHDVDRSVADNDVITSFRDSLSRQQEPKKNDSFLRSLQQDRTQELLLEPMQNYNHFAKQYSCEIDLPNKAFWTHYLPIDDKYQLCLNGLTTTFFSCSKDNNRTLYLGEFQAYIEQKKGTVNLAMFHHPKDWLDDGDKFEDLLTDNAEIWLSGHKHRQRYTADDRYLDLPSAAVNPSIWESELSGYNIIDISVSEPDEHAYLDLSVMMRMLQEAPKQYIAKKTHNKEDVLTHRIRIPKVTEFRSNHSSNVLTPTIQIVTKNEVADKYDKDTSEFKNLTNRIWGLQASKRLGVFASLSIEVESDPLTDEEGFMRQALERVQKENLLDDFEMLIIEQEKV